MLRTCGESTLKRNEQQENNPKPPNQTEKKPKNPTKTKNPTTQQNKSYYLNCLTLEVKSTDYQNEELLIPTLTTVVRRFSSKHILCC